MNFMSDESLNTSADLTSSTLQNFSLQPKHVYYADESDEGLVKYCFFYLF